MEETKAESTGFHCQRRTGRQRDLVAQLSRTDTYIIGSLLALGLVLSGTGDVVPAEEYLLRHR